MFPGPKKGNTLVDVEEPGKDIFRYNQEHAVFVCFEVYEYVGYPPRESSNDRRLDTAKCSWEVASVGYRPVCR